MPEAKCTAIARSFLEARSGAAKLSVEWAKAQSLTAQEAYTVQSLVAAELGPVGGFKFAQRPGQPAIMAPIQRTNIMRSGGYFAADEPVGIELEVGFRLDADPPPLDTPGYLNNLRACVTPVAVIELVQTRLADPDAAPAMLKLADHQLNGGLVVGEAMSNWEGEPLESVEARLAFGDQVVLDGPVTLPFGPAVDCLTELARIVGDHCGGLRTGHIVITGSLNGLPWLSPGAKVDGRIESIGEVAVNLS